MSNKLTFTAQLCAHKFSRTKKNLNIKLTLLLNFVTVYTQENIHFAVIKNDIFRKMNVS